MGAEVCVAGRCLQPCAGPGANCPADFECEGLVCVPD
jgi:hypothetical protein